MFLHSCSIFYDFFYLCKIKVSLYRNTRKLTYLDLQFTQCRLESFYFKCIKCLHIYFLLKYLKSCFWWYVYILLVYFISFCNLLQCGCKSDFLPVFFIHLSYYLSFILFVHHLYSLFCPSFILAIPADFMGLLDFITNVCHF